MHGSTTLKQKNTQNQRIVTKKQAETKNDNDARANTTATNKPIKSIPKPIPTTATATATTTTTTTTSITPITDLVLYPPVNFSKVCKGIYRCGFPTKKNFQFLKTLRLKSIIYLCEEEYPPSNLKFVTTHGISLLEFGGSGNKEPFTHMDPTQTRKAVRAAMDPDNQPVLIHCNQGKHRTGCVVGCIRKEMNWSLCSIFNEYRMLSHPKERFLDQQFIELF